MNDLKKARRALLKDINNQYRRELLKYKINQYYAEEMLVSLLQSNYTEGEICKELSKMIKRIEGDVKKC